MKTRMARGSISTTTLLDSRFTKHVLKRVYFKGLCMVGGNTRGVRAEKRWRDKVLMRCENSGRGNVGSYLDLYLLESRFRGCPRAK